MDDEESNRRINDVYSKWEKKAPSLEDRVRATHNTGRSNAWENAFADHDVSAGRVERKMRQSKPRRRNVSMYEFVAGDLWNVITIYIIFRVVIGAVFSGVRDKLGYVPAPYWRQIVTFQFLFVCMEMDIRYRYKPQG